MRILMLGNSFTTANHMPDMLADRCRDCATYPWRGTIGRSVKSENKDGKAYTGSFAK